MAAKNEDVDQIFNWEWLPACAPSCKILEISALNCVPPAAPVADPAIYEDCVCRSEYLRELHMSGEICHSACSQEEDIIIMEYYNNMCGMQAPMATQIPSTTSTAMVTPSSTSAVTDAPVSSSSASPESHQEGLKDDGSWIHKYGKYLGIAGGSIVVLTLIIFMGIFFLRRHNKTKRKLERARNNRSIPLQPLTSSTPPSRPFNDYWPSPLTPYAASPPISPVTGRPLGESLRVYASEREDVPRDPAASVNSLRQMEAIINDRLRRTGHPGIPLRDTPKIAR